MWRKMLTQNLGQNPKKSKNPFSKECLGMLAPFESKELMGDISSHDEDMSD